MNDDSSPRPSFLERLTAWLSREPDNKEELLELLHAAYENNLLDADALSMIEGVMQVSEMQVREIMIPRAQMDVVDINDPPEKLLPFIIETAHSRFPAIDGDRDDVVGILLAKDLLRLCTDEEVDLRDMLRPAVFIPESKRLNVLLREFRASRNHIAIVVDEYGGVAGLVTIEDVLEQIVGDIEDEFDEEEAEHGIYTLADGSHRVAGDVDIEAVNHFFSLRLPEDDFDTIGGLVAHELGRVPRRGESVPCGGLIFTVMLTRGGAVRWFRVERTSEARGTAAEGLPG